MAENGSDRGGGRRHDRGTLGVIRTVKEELEELLGRPAETVSAMSRTDDGWQLRVEVVELEKVPPTTNVMASYEVEADGGGEITSYELVKRYHAGQVGEDEG